MLGRVLNKIMEDELEEGLIVCPFWPNQTSIPLLLSVLVSFPVRLPRHRDLLTLPFNRAMLITEVGILV